MKSVLTPTKVTPERNLVEAYSPLRGYFINTFNERITKFGNADPVHAYRHLNVNTEVLPAIHFYATYVVYNYKCNIGDTFSLLIDNDEFTLFIKEDGVYYMYLSNEDAEGYGEAYHIYDRLPDSEGSF